MTTTQIHYPFRQLLADAWPYVRLYQRRFWLATFLRFTGDMAGLYFAYGLASIVTFVSTYRVGDSLDPLYWYAGLWLVASAWMTFGVWSGKYLVFQLAERASLDVQLAAIKHLFALDVAWHERENTGNKVKRIQRGGESLNQLLRIWIHNAIEIVVTFGGMLLILSRFDQQITLALILFLILYFFVSRKFTVQAVGAAREVNEREEEVSGLMYQAAANIRTVKSLGATPAMLALLSDESRLLMTSLRRRILFYQSRGGVLMFMSQIVKFGWLFFIAFGVIAGRYTVGFLVLFNGYFNSLQMSSRELADVSQEYVIHKQAFARLMAMLREPIVMASEEGKVPLPQEWQTIRFDQVSFRYGATDVLRDITFTIKRGEKIGIVGLSGAGKSTLMKLLLKEYEPQTGKIFIDSVPLSDISNEDYLKRVAAVFQETEVFNFSLRMNVAIVNPKVIDEGAVQRAIAVSHVSDFIPKLPQGLETLIGEKGVKLSGGEKQRLGIARAVYKMPDLLLLDEATSHLDLESEGKIQDSLHQVFQSVTAVVIAHRLTTIKEMDRILVIEGGKIIEEGSFAQLLKKKGRFFQLWEKQKF